VRKAGRDPDLLLEPLGTSEGRGLQREDLEGHPPAVPGVARGIDHGHAAPPEFILELVAVGECSGEVEPVVAHGE
jgi:hypothetical protein